MTPESPKTPREELEARLTALLLGELSAEEAAALRHTIEQDAELARLENQLKETIGLVRQAAASKDEKTIEPAAALQLSAERREKLLASFKTTRLEIPSKPRRKLRLNRELLKLAAMVVALLLVGGVVVSYFAPKAKSRAQRLDRGITLRLWSGDDSSPARVTTINGSGPAVLSFESSDSPAAPVYAVNGQFPANRGRTPAGSVIANELAEGRYYAGVPPALPNTPPPSAEYAGVSVAAGGGRRNTPPPPVASPAPAKKLPQLAQNSERFRTTIALPASSETQPSDALSDVSGELVARSGGTPVGRASSRADAFGNSAIEASDKLQVEVLGEETNSRRRSGLAGGPGGFGGGGGFGGARGPIAASEGKDAGRVPDAGFPTPSAMAFANQTPGKSQQFGEVADGVDLPNVGMVPATPAQPGGLADAKTSVPAADPNRGAGAMGDQSFGWAAKESRANKPTTTTEQNADWFGADDVNGFAPAIAQNPVGRASPPAIFGSGPAPAIAPNPVPSVAPSTGLPVATGVLMSESETASVLSRDGAVLAGDKNRDLAGAVDGEAAAFLNGREVKQQVPNRPVLLAAKPVETPAPDRKVQEKAVAGQPLSVTDELDHTIELYNISPLATKGTVQSYSHALIVNDGLAIDHGQHTAGVQLGDLSGTLIADPTHGTGDGREWGIRQKLDADGDSVARNSLLGDLTQSQSKKKAPAEVQDKLAKVARGDAGKAYSANVVGYVTNAFHLPQTAPAKAPPVLDEERKKESGIAGSESITVQRVNGSDGRVTVDYSTPEGAAKPPGQVVLGGNFTTLEDSKRASEEAVYRKSRVEIALPPGGENAQGVEREPRVQVGPVAVNEVQFESLEEKKGSFANRLNQTVSRAASGTDNRTQISGQAELDEAGKLLVERIREKQAELERLSKLNQSLQTASREDLRKMLTTASPDPDLASVLKGLSVEANRRGLLQGEQAELNERNRYELYRLLDERLEGVRSNVKARLEQLQTEVAKEQPLDLAKLKDADLSQALDMYQDLTGRKVLRAGALPPAKITMDIPTTLSREEKIQALDTVLAMNQLATTVQGTNYLKVVPAPQAAQEAEKFNAMPAELTDTVTYVAKLTNALPNDVQQVIQPFANLPQSIVTIPDSGMIVMRDKPENVARMVEMVKRIDVVPVQEFGDVVIPLKSAPAADIARMLQNSAATGELPAAGRAKIIPDERSNSLLIFAGKEDLSSISNAIRRLDAPIPQGEVETAENFFSTFSLNVSDVSFKLAAASLEKGQMPDPSTVRSEEFINAFDYRDPEPKGSAPIAFAWERARYPFAHNRDLLRFSVKTAASGRQPDRPLNLVLLLDNSGSMERADRVRVIRECLRVLAGQLQPQDRVSVVAFARTARLVVDGFSGGDAKNLPEVIGQLAPDGGTNLEDAMNVAYQAALKHFLPNGVNRVVLLTDGAANLGDVEPESLKKKVEAHRKQGVALDCFGIGWDGYNDDLLEVLSRNGDGRYGFVNTPEAAASEFAGQLAGALRVAASDVKVQVQFNPRRVTAYRQIGYAKHQLKKEQFRDNTVDAAEIGAAEQGNALYTVQVNPNGEGPLGVVRVRFKVPGTSDYREHEWAVPYSGAATPLEQSSPALRLAATASAFSEWLVSSPFAAEVTPDRLLGYLSGVPETCAADPRPKKLEWMIRQAKSLAGK